MMTKFNSYKKSALIVTNIAISVNKSARWPSQSVVKYPPEDSPHALRTLQRLCLYREMLIIGNGFIVPKLA